MLQYGAEPCRLTIQIQIQDKPRAAPPVAWLNSLLQHTGYGTVKMDGTVADEATVPIGYGAINSFVLSIGNYAGFNPNTP